MGQALTAPLVYLRLHGLLPFASQSGTGQACKTWVLPRSILLQGRPSPVSWQVCPFPKKVGFLHKRFPKFNTSFSESVNAPMRSNEGGEKEAEITVL